MVITNTAATILTKTVRALIFRPPLFAFKSFRRFSSQKVYMRQRLLVPRFGMGGEGTAGGLAPSAVSRIQGEPAQETRSLGVMNCHSTSPGCGP